MGKIASSVGKGGKNNSDDVLIVKGLLNKHRPTVGYGRLKDTGECDRETIQAIEAFQRAIGLPKPDGRVDVGGKTLKALDGKEVAKTPEVAPGKGGKVIGDLSGVESNIVDFVKAVADFYGRDIRISSGKRSAREQGAAMFNNWTGNLKRGHIYKYLKSNTKTLNALDKLYSDAVEDKKKSKKEAETAKAEFISTCTDLADKLSMHVAGKAIDISPKSCMTPAMRQAMQTGLRELEEKSCYHYDTSGKGSAPKVTDALKKSWKAP